jgi:septin family protein
VKSNQTNEITYDVGQGYFASSNFDKLHKCTDHEKGRKMVFQFHDHSITGQPGLGNTTFFENFMAQFDPKFNGVANGETTSWSDFRANPSKYEKRFTMKLTEDIELIINGLETPGMGQEKNIMSDVLELAKIIIGRIKEEFEQVSQQFQFQFRTYGLYY